MFFNRDKKIGNNLGTLAFMLTDQQMKEEAVSQMELSKTEVIRFKFCLSVLNLITFMWWVNVLERDNNRAVKIIDNIREGFTEISRTRTDAIRIGDFIADPLELVLVDKEMFHSGITENTETDYTTLIGVAYNIRVDDYVKALKELRQIALSQSDSFSLNPVAKLFTRHFTGAEWENRVDLVIMLSILLCCYQLAIADLIKKAL